MIVNRKTFVALTACLILTASTVFAGGGGSVKPNSTIRIKNTTGAAIGVAAGKTADNIIAGPVITTTKQFTDAGGKILNDGDTVDIKVTEGNNTVLAANAGLVVIGIVKVPVARGQTRLVTVDGTGVNF